MTNKKQLPVYLFTGFLDAGKTTFINNTLMGDKRFTEGKRILLVLCEQGEEEYQPEKFLGGGVRCITVGDAQELAHSLHDEEDPDLVLIEYNGMWPLDELYRALPEHWLVAQETAFFDGTTILSYNANMRAHVADKLQSCDLAVFNRLVRGCDLMPFHKLVRGLSRSATIVYDYTDGTTERDEIEDPLPFDLDAPIVELRDEDFAIWYRDISEEPDKYHGKTIKLRGMVAKDPSLLKNELVIGRKIMTCCADDIMYAGPVAEYRAADLFAEGDWVMVTGKLVIKKHRLYEAPGPVLKVTQLARTDPPREEIVTFY